jgi:chorismate mutase / prephenate dehydratase
MTVPSRSIDDLRDDIDVIDDEMHELLMRRVDVVEQIGALKNAAPGDLAIRPAREARILRRLVAQHRGRFPALVVVRIWRELIAATTRLQGPFSIAVNAPEKFVGYWDVARDQYGSATKATLHCSANSVIRAVVDGTATIGILPIPAEDDAVPWWPHLIFAGANIPRIIARLPFIEHDHEPFEDLGALAIALSEQEASGDDVSFIAVEASAGLSRDSLKQAFDVSGLPATGITAWSEIKRAPTQLHLVQVGDFVGAGDARLDAAAAKLGDQIIRFVGLGGYAVPIGKAQSGGG